MPENPSDFINTVRYLLPRTELMNDGYAVQSTAYALMAHIQHNGMGLDTETKIQRDSMMRWLNYMRNFIGGFASTQVRIHGRSFQGKILASTLVTDIMI